MHSAFDWRVNLETGAAYGFVSDVAFQRVARGPSNDAADEEG